MKRQHQSVYVMRTEDLGGGLTKVGIAECAYCRRRTLACHRRMRDLRLVRTWQRDGDARQIERLAHRLLAPHRRGNEWFDVSPRVACAAVAKIARCLDLGWTPAEVAEKYDVSRQTVYVRYNAEAIARLRGEIEDEG